MHYRPLKVEMFAQKFTFSLLYIYNICCINILYKLIVFSYTISNKAN